MIDHQKIDSKAQVVLRGMSWRPGRRVDPIPFEEALRLDGYEVFPIATDFLAEFGGLSGHKPAYRVVGSVEGIHFDPRLAISNIYRERVGTYERSLGERLVVIGESSNSHLTILLSESGRLFTACDDEVFVLGEDVPEGLSALFGNRILGRLLITDCGGE